jgi:hypothetical protein
LHSGWSQCSLLDAMTFYPSTQAALSHVRESN